MVQRTAPETQSLVLGHAIFYFIFYDRTRDMTENTYDFISRFPSCFLYVKLIKDEQVVNAGIVQLESARPFKKPSEMKHPPVQLLGASELFYSTKESIFKKLLLVERRTVKLLRAGLHHCCSDKDQEV